MPTFDEIRATLVKAGGASQAEVAATLSGDQAALVQARGPRRVPQVIAELKTVWASAVTNWPAYNGRYYAPPTREFPSSIPCTQFVMETYMVNGPLWREAQATLAWYLAHEPPVSDPDARAGWVFAIIQWCGIAILAADLNEEFWCVSSEETNEIRVGMWCNNEQLAALGCTPAGTGVAPECPAGVGCPPRDRPWTPLTLLSWTGASGSADTRAALRTRIQAATAGYTTAAWPGLFMFDLQDQIERTGAPVAGVIGELSWLPQPGAFNTKDDYMRTRGRFWKDLELGPGWRVYGDIADTDSLPIPVPVLTTFDAETPRNWDAAKRAYRAFTKLPALEQLARIFRAMGPHAPGGASPAAVVPATHKADAPPLWTAATPEGLMEQARRNARWWSTTDLDTALGRALQCYTGNHIPYFVARGEFGPDVTMADLHAAHEDLKRKGSRELGAIMSAAAGVLGAFNAVAGVVAAIVVGLYSLWTELSGGSVFPFGLPPDFHQPQPLFMRTMPVCEELARTKAAVDTAISHIPSPGSPVPKIPGFVFGIAGVAAAFGLVKLIWRK